MIRNLLLIVAICLASGAGAQTTSYNERVRQYVAQYREFAIMEQQRIGVPAAVTLGQGILETQAGQSELATVANNHFGIKCKKEWTGDTFAHDDDAPQECFRKYPSALHSYKDHSDYLRTSKRYNSCFACNPTDYASWARELRKCGYATNPNYAGQLIKIIEDFHLQDYTYAAMQSKQPVLIASAAAPVASVMMAEKASEPVSERDTPSASSVPAADNPVYGKTTHKDGVKGFYAHKGDVLLEYAIQYKVRYAKLLEINGLPDAPLTRDMFVALERGSKVTQILSRDASEPAVASPAASPVVAVVKEQPTEQPVVATAEPVVEKPADKTSSAPVQVDMPDNKAVEHIAPVIVQEKPVPPVSEPIVKPAEQAAIPSDKPVAVATEPVRQSPAAAEKPVNIANEVAVEETKPAKEEPKDEFSRMKARFDKVVYAPTKAPQAKPATVAPEETKTNTATVIASAPPTAEKEFHVVQKGETAFSIAKRYNMTMKELMTLNKLDFEAIKVGQKLRVR